VVGECSSKKMGFKKKSFSSNAMDESLKPHGNDPDGIIDLGQMDSLKVPANQLYHEQLKRVDGTRAYLAFFLASLLAIVLVLLIVMLWLGKLDIKGFTQIAGVVLAPVVALLGTATGYYYGRNER
jgi:hypothetical protein